jgi:transposase
LTCAVEIKPPACPGCGHALDGQDPEPARHQVAELREIRPEVIEYRLHRMTCPGCGVATRARLPADVPRGAFGPRLQAWAGLLSGAYRLNKRQVQRLFDDLLGVSISTGMVAKLQRRAGQILAGPMTEIVEVVRQAEAVHVDETGWREAGKKAWLWVGVAAKATAFGVHRSRGHDALGALLGEGPGRDRVIISDRFPTYARAPNRQLCWAHPRRDMQVMVDRGSGGELVGQRLLDQSRWIFTWWRRLGEGAIARTTLRSYVAGLRGAVALLLREGSTCGCAWTAKVCRKILEDERHLWTFAEVEGVAPDTNAAERALRHGVIWRKLSLGTASEAGSRFVERLLSVVETCRQRGRSAAAYLTACFVAERTGRPIPSPLT